MQRFSLIALLAFIALASADNSLFVGHRESGDELMEQKEIDKGWFPFKIVKEDVTISGDGNHVITRVEAYDLKKKDTSATANIVSGGPRQTYVTVEFKSARGHGIHFLLKVYGKRIN